jgi:hypothetical protein
MLPPKLMIERYYESPTFQPDTPSNGCAAARVTLEGPPPVLKHTLRALVVTVGS